jgi:hypothetical protein
MGHLFAIFAMRLVKNSYHKNMVHIKNPAFLAVLGLIFCLPIFARAELSFAKVQGALTGVPPPEIPVRAANVVLQAGNEDKESATTNVLLAVVEMNPCAVPSTVAQIARTSPALAPLAAATAVSLQPNQIFLITKATVGAVPNQITEVVSAIVGRIPSQYIGVAEAAAQVYPSAGTNILKGVVLSIPVLGSFIDTLVAKNPPGEDLPVVAILNQSTMMALHRLSTPAPPSAVPASHNASPNQEAQSHPASSPVQNK